ncbi:bifunctional DNA-formamidopyrimidine glycosylase/DNA-(apurinic or apyrimidinic site) lyase [Vibrio ulleungensis]|uniref:Formamidopyrimidine-DNA glycosylase n=1 Tax=Vibrio ulleungensis TaxID=2807619 RepID=A0ABS2HJJ7_9VIBR|nr:bifunctional DNA-formamidopyrimidine glycosylase/DNA-(apurinic or apyrimidinic site) lyase [Vibrio ulleungensis]MBM7037680.1 bifunctional DNA-formamidopyrimidine glycosylase/DNA-(apurinic or apyrimidinic site) lyase [Vibrio ulleungensis]
MPELPEVEVSRLGTAPHLVGQTITNLTIRQPRLRWPVPEQIADAIGHQINSVERRAKYLLIQLDVGTIVVHLGMSGSLRVLKTPTSPAKHDHVDMVLSNGVTLRYNDPRRFGCWLWFAKGENIELLSHLGPEPLTASFCLEYVWPLAQKRKITIKQFIMDNKVVVGVGNIYANEALFNAKISPLKSTHSVKKTDLKQLIEEIKHVLDNAIKQGGTTLNDFEQPDGKPGYFAQVLSVYGKEGEPCPICATKIRAQSIAKRNTFWCERCQSE